MRDGRQALVLRFIAKSTCAFGGDSGSLMTTGKTFRAYAEFREEVRGDAIVYRNWDRVQDDYRLGCVGFDRSAGYRATWVHAFDRQHELLKP